MARLLCRLVRILFLALFLADSMWPIHASIQGGTEPSQSIISGSKTLSRLIKGLCLFFSWVALKNPEDSL